MSDMMLSLRETRELAAVGSVADKEAAAGRLEQAWGVSALQSGCTLKGVPANKLPFSGVLLPDPAVRLRQLSKPIVIEAFLTATAKGPIDKSQQSSKASHGATRAPSKPSETPAKAAGSGNAVTGDRNIASLVDSLSIAMSRLDVAATLVRGSPSSNDPDAEDACTLRMMETFTIALQLACEDASSCGGGSVSPPWELVSQNDAGLEAAEGGTTDGPSGSVPCRATVRLFWHGAWRWLTMPAEVPVHCTDSVDGFTTMTAPAHRLDGGCEAQDSVPPRYAAWPALLWAAWVRLGGLGAPLEQQLPLALSALTGALRLLPSPRAEAHLTGGDSCEAGTGALLLMRAVAALPRDAPTLSERVREWCFLSEEATRAWVRGVEAAQRSERLRLRIALQAAAQAGIDVSPAAEPELTPAIGTAAGAATAPAATGTKPPTATRRGSVAPPAVSDAEAAKAAIIRDCVERPIAAPPRPFVPCPLPELCTGDPDDGDAPLIILRC